MRLKNLYNYISPGIIPFLIALVLLLLVIIDNVTGIFTIGDIITNYKELFEKHGYIILLLAAFAEALFMFSFYLPGSLVIVLSVLVSDKSLNSLILIGLFTLLGFMLANIINFFLGKYGYYRVLLFLGKGETINKMNKWFTQKKLVTIFISAIHPNFLAMAIVSSGIAKSNFYKIMFFSMLSLVFWIAIWLIIAPTFLKYIDIENPNNSWFIFYFFIFWGVINIIVTRIKSKKHN